MLTDGWTEKQMPISHHATSRCDNENANNNMKIFILAKKISSSVELSMKNFITSGPGQPALNSGSCVPQLRVLITKPCRIF